MKNSLGIYSGCIKPDKYGKVFNETETLKIIKDVGFDSFFTNQYSLNNVKELKTMADKLGLEFTSIHAPFKGINDIWKDGEDYKFIYNGLIKTIDSASEFNVPTIVMHVSSTWRPPKICDLGFNRLDEIVDYSIKKGVKIAFENLRVKEYLDMVMARYKTVKSVGFCYDFGHESCFDGSKNLYLPKYGERLIATHIHDNVGRTIIDDTIHDDKHYLPLDGNIDYKTIFDNLKTIGYNGPLTLEVVNDAKSSYKELTPQEFVFLAYERLNKIIS